MKVVDGTQMKQLDRTAVEKYGIPSILLMENAGIAVTEEVLKAADQCSTKEILILCGLGNNGGDGFVVARQLHQRGLSVKVRVIGEIAKIRGDARVNYDILRKIKVDIEQAADLEKLKLEIRESTLIVDAIFGTGLCQEINERIKQIIDEVNEANKVVISIDIPSGVFAKDGSLWGRAIQATKTVSLQMPKIGNINYPGADYTGELIVKEIGIPREAILDAGIHTSIITHDVVRKILPQRKRDTHKGDYGKVYIVAGSTGMTGAAMLTCEAVLRSGAGLLKVAIPQSLNNIMEIRLTEAITVPLPELKKGVVGISDIEKIVKTMKQSDVIAIGPGSGQTRELEEVLRNIFEEACTPIVLDADAINALAHRIEYLKQLQHPIVLTPHVGEMSRLTGLPVEEINRSRIEVARKYAKEWNATIILKGARTVVANPLGEIYINCTGNPGMATAGSGDVLTGIVTGFIAQGIQPFEAAMAAVYVHGKAGDRAAARLGEYGLMAGDIISELPYAIKEVVGR